MENTKKEDKKVKEPNVEEPKVEEPKVEEPKVKETKVEEPKVEEPKVEEKAKKKLILKNTLGKNVPLEDYFFRGEIPAGFEGTCGSPVDRDDLVEVFNKVFKPEDNILFYKQDDKEVYLIIVPLRYSNEIGEEQNSLEGDFHKHAISFLNEGSVNPDTLRKKLERINQFVNYSDR